LEVIFHPNDEDVKILRGMGWRTISSGTARRSGGKRPDTLAHSSQAAKHPGNGNGTLCAGDLYHNGRKDIVTAGPNGIVLLINKAQ
jgi:hypothetical protein